MPKKASELGACKDLEGHIFTIGLGNKGKEGDMLCMSKKKMATYIRTKYGDKAAQDVIGHGLMLSLSIAKWHDLQNSQSLVYNGDRQAPPDLLNLLPEGTNLDPGVWLMRHKSIPAFPRRKASASSSR